MKEYIGKHKVSLINHVIGLGILMVGFALGRYVFFDVHGMKEFPVNLLVLGLAVMLISVLGCGMKKNDVDGLRDCFI